MCVYINILKRISFISVLYYYYQKYKKKKQKKKKKKLIKFNIRQNKYMKKNSLLQSIYAHIINFYFFKEHYETMISNSQRTRRRRQKNDFLTLWRAAYIKL